MTVDEILVRLTQDVPMVDIRGLVGIVNQKQRQLATMWSWRFFHATGTITLTEPYETGTVTTTNGSTTVTGLGTTWVSATHVGQKFRLTDIAERYDVYTISAVGSTTSLTLDRSWAPDAQAAEAYRIYQNEYALPSDIQRLVEVRDAETGAKMTPRPRRDESEEWWQASAVDIPSTGYFPQWWEGTQWGKDDNGYYKIKLRHVPTEERQLNVFYHKWPTAVTNVASSVDCAAYQEELLFQLILQRFASRLPGRTQEELYYRQAVISENRQEIQTQLKEAKRADVQIFSPTLRNKRVLV